MNGNTATFVFFSRSCHGLRLLTMTSSVGPPSSLYGTVPYTRAEWSAHCLLWPQSCAAEESAPEPPLAEQQQQRPQRHEARAQQHGDEMLRGRPGQQLQARLLLSRQVEARLLARQWQ